MGKRHDRLLDVLSARWTPILLGIVLVVIVFNACIGITAFIIAEGLHRETYPPQGKLYMMHQAIVKLEGGLVQLAGHVAGGGATMGQIEAQIVALQAQVTTISEALSH